MDINFGPVERNTLSEEIIKQIISLINTGKLKPGSRLPSERELMEIFHVSRSSVREALHSLTVIGLLETFPGAGTYVSKQLVDIIGGKLEWAVLLGNQELTELVEVREPLEIQAAGLAAERATPESIVMLREAIENYHNCINNPKELMAAESQVHLAIAQMAGNRTLVRTLQTFQTILHEYRSNQQVGFTLDATREQEYWSILQAIEVGDSDTAREAMAAHLQRSKTQALVEQINVHSSNPG